MFRLRRYRVFIVFALIVVGLFYHFRSIGDLQEAGVASVEGLKHFGQKVETAAKNTKEQAADEANDRFNGPDAGVSSSSISTTASSSARTKETSTSETKKILATAPRISKDATAPKETEASSTTIKFGQKKNTDLKAAATSASLPDTDKEEVTSPDDELDNIADAPKSGVEAGKEYSENTDDTNVPRIHWSKQPEHFPVPTESLIPLPTDEPLSIPQIQYAFSSEKGEGKLAQKEKLDTIKEAFAFSWAGYKEKAWMHDELSPKSGKYRNPFCGWGATLIDTLDTLWLMDMKDEFDEALEALRKVDFTTSMRNDIPLFETVIRYLGGLIGAFDISGGTHKIILEKAVELGEILIGSFDTPNRMPMTFYLWKPTFASQPHRAKTRVVLAELGTLSLEFTRLAQLTKEDKYYDAIARITNEFEIWQNQTSLPGLWPLRVDASGCRKAAKGFQGFENVDLSSSSNRDEKPLTSSGKVSKINATGVDSKDQLTAKGKADSSKDEDADQSTSRISRSSRKTRPRTGSEDDALDSKLATAPETKRRAAHERRDLVDSTAEASTGSAQKSSSQSDCEPQGLVSPPSGSTEEYSLGGMADSTYEYLPKEYLLLGGSEVKYRRMYELAADAAKKHLIYRPMIPDEKRSILQSGLLQVTGKKGSSQKLSFEPEGTHLTCFVGGMFAMGAKIFGRQEDLDFGKRLTDSCIWAYESTKTGIMPESYLSIACNQIESCTWNETLWQEKLDPYGAQREKQRVMKQQELDNGKETNHEKDDSQTPLDVSSQSSDEERSSSKATKSKPNDRKKVKQAADEDEPKASSGSSGETESLESKLFRNTDIAEEEPLPKHGQTKSKTSDDGPTAKRPLSKRQLGEVDEKPLKAESKPEAQGKATIKDSSSKPKTSKTDMEASFDRTNTEDEVENVKEPSSKSPEARKSSADAESLPKVKADKTRPKTQDTTRLESTSDAVGIPTREEFVAEKIKNERLPLGMTKVTNARYHLR